MTAHDSWLDPPEDDEPDMPAQDPEPDETDIADDDYGSDEIERIRDQRYDQ